MATIVLLVRHIQHTNAQQYQQQYPQQQVEVVFTETVTESRDVHLQTATAFEATKTVYMIPTQNRPWWVPQQHRPTDGYYEQPYGDEEQFVETETHYIQVTVTPPCPPLTVAPLTVTTAITTTITKTAVQVRWRSVPVEIRYYQTVTETTTARPLIADLLPRVSINDNNEVRVRTTTVFVPNNGDVGPMAGGGETPPQPTATQTGPVDLRIPQVPMAGQLARNLEYQIQTTAPPTLTRTAFATTTVLSTITPGADWGEAKKATMNECDLCRQKCADLSSKDCCVRECAGVMQQVPVPVPMMPPLMPLNPDAIPCDD